MLNCEFPPKLLVPHNDAEKTLDHALHGVGRISPCRSSLYVFECISFVIHDGDTL